MSSIRLRNVATNANEMQISRKTGGTLSILFSYETPVAAYIPGRGFVRTEEHFSKTTTKHIDRWTGPLKAPTIPQREIEALLDI